MKIVELFLSMGLRFKILSGLLLSIIPMVAIAGISYYSARNNEIENSERIMKLIAQNGAREINGFIKAQESIFLDWTREDVFGMAIEFQTTRELQDHFKSMLKGQKGFSLLMLADKEGKVLEALAGEHIKDIPPDSFKGRRVKHASGPMSKSVHFATLVESDFMKQLKQRSATTYRFSFKAMDSNGKPNGLFLAYLDWDNLQTKIESVFKEMKTAGFNNAEVGILDMASGMVVGHSNDEMIGSVPELEDSLKSWLKESVDGEVRKFDLGKNVDYITSFVVQMGDMFLDGGNASQSASNLRLTLFVPERDIMSQVQKILWTSIGIAGVGGLLVFFIGLFISFSITRPIIKGVDFARGMSLGDFTATLDIDQKDEIGVLADALNKMVSNLGQMIREIAENSKTLSGSASNLSSIANQMSSGADSMSGKSNTVAASAEEMSANMTSVAAAIEQASTNVGIVATASEDMMATINEIAQNSEKARTITGEAVSQAKSASGLVEELGNAAQNIGKVTETITEISEQTNLLALNATIEAARAGDAGKGFAVVANEIKELARQTADATQQIKGKIGGIQDSTAATVTEIEQITKVIDDVNEIVSTIATAVEEQSVTTKEIVNNVQQASQGIQEVTENVTQSSTVAREIAGDISEVNQSTGEMSNSSSQVNLSAGELNNLAGQLEDTVGRFKV